MKVSRIDKGSPAEAVVKIPVLGSYSPTWPLNCPKSEKIVRGQADYLARTNANGMGLGVLFLLSTGEEKDLEVVRGWMKAEVAKHKEARRIDNTNPGIPATAASGSANTTCEPATRACCRSSRCTPTTSIATCTTAAGTSSAA